jgi:hypothetical protein
MKWIKHIEGIEKLTNCNKYIEVFICTDGPLWYGAIDLHRDFMTWESEKGYKDKEKAKIVTEKALIKILNKINKIGK